MMRSVIGWSIRGRRLVLALGLVLMVLGVLQLGSMPADVLPEFRPPTVEIQTEALGLSAAEVEQLITAPMEQNLLNGVAWLDTIRSRSVPGLSSVELVFEPGTDLTDARQVVQERLTQAHGALPRVSRAPQMLQPLSSTSRVMMLRLSSDRLSLIQQSVLARWTIRPRLLGVPGVANVAIWGQRERQLQVQVDPEHLRSKQVTLDQVLETAGNALWVSPLTFLEASTPGTGGFFDTPNQRLGIQHLLPIDTPEDLANVTLEGCAGPPSATRHVDANCPQHAAGLPAPTLRLGDVASVVEDHQPLIGDAVFAEGKGLLLVVERFPEADVVDVTRGVEQALEALAPGLSDLRMDASLFRPADYIERSSSNVTTALVLGLILMVLALAATLFDWRAVVTVVATVVLAMAAAVTVLGLTGATLNAMVLAGLALAVAVVADDAVIGTYAVRRRLEGNRRANVPETNDDIVAEATLGTRAPLAHATVVVIMAVLPIVVLTGQSGAFLPALAASYVAAVVSSMVVGLVLAPALVRTIMPGAKVAQEDAPVVRAARRRYDHALADVLRRPGRPYTAAVLLVAGALVALPSMGTEPSMVPPFKERDLLVRWEGPPGTSLVEMQRITSRVGRELQGVPGVESVGAHAGRAMMADRIVGANAAELWVRLDPGAPYERTVEAVEEVIGGYPGIDGAVLTYARQRVADVIPKGAEDVSVRIFGQDFSVMDAKAREVRQAFGEIDGIVNPHVELRATEPTLEVQVDLAAARASAVKPGDVRRAAAAYFAGIEVGNLFEDQKVFEVVVIGAPSTRLHPDAVSHLLVDTPTGHARLGDVAEVRIAQHPNVIRHEAVSRTLDVSATVVGRDIRDVARDVEHRLEAIDFPLEHHAELLGDHAEQRAAGRRFAGVVAGVAVGALLLLQAAFGSWRLALVAFLGLPVALAGGVLAARADGSTVTLATYAGLLAGVALAARTGVGLIRRWQELEARPSAVFGPELVREGASEALGPSLARTVAVVAALLPMVLLGNLAGLEMLRPMAVVVLGGLVAATLFPLFVMPSLYLRIRSGRAETVGLHDPELRSGPSSHGEFDPIPDDAAGEAVVKAEVTSAGRDAGNGRTATVPTSGGDPQGADPEPGAAAADPAPGS